MIFADIALQLAIFLGIGMAEACTNNSDGLTAVLETGNMGCGIIPRANPLTMTKRLSSSLISFWMD